MRSSSPYQPVLLRLLHGAAAILAILALISGFLVYNNYDRRWGGINLPKLEYSQDIHGTIALTFLLVLPVFAFYCFHLGERRLLQSESIDRLSQVGEPIWWISLHRLANTLMLVATTFAVITGRMMKEEWLPAGEINRPWYLAHLLGWVGVLVSFALHLLLGAKVGGLPLLVSMFKIGVREGDTPSLWLRGISFAVNSTALKIVEIVVIGGILMAFILPIFNI